MHLPRRVGIAGLAIVLSLLATTIAFAQSAANFPDRAVRIVVPFAPGGFFDAMARLIGDGMSRTLRQPIVVENRPGALGSVGTQAVTQAPADGYTLLFTTLPAVSDVFIKNPPYDVRKDLVAVSEIFGASGAIIVVNSQLPVKSMRELADYARANPGKLNYGAGSAVQMMTFELFKSIAKVDIVGINYKGSAPATTALLANEVQMMLDAPVSQRAHIDAGKVRGIGMTHAQRNPAFPDVPTTTESGFPTLVIPNTTGLFARAGVSADIVAKLNAAINEALRNPELVRRAEAGGSTVTGGSPEAFGRAALSQLDFWANAARIANFKPE